MIECAFQGRSGAAAVMAESRSGRVYAKFSVAVRGKGEEQPEWVQCVAFDDVARDIADLAKGEKVYVEGELRLNRWAPEDGDERANLSCVARKAVVLERIGRKRRGLKRVSVDGRDPRLEDEREHRERQLEDMNDPIPF